MRHFLSLWFAFCIAVVAATALGDAPQTGGNVDSIQTALDRLSAMQPSQQQAWLKRLEERAFRAALLAFKPDESAKKQADVRAKLHQPSITLDTLREVVQDTDVWEKDAITRLAKQYRQQVFEVFHQDLHVYADRQRAWLELQQSWKDAGSPFEPQNQLIDWLEAAIRSASTTKTGPIPPKPSLEVEKLPPMVVKRQDAKPKAAPVAKPQAVAKAQEPVKPQAIAKSQEIAKSKAVETTKEPKVAKPQTIVKQPVVELPPMPAIEPAVTPLERSLVRVPLHQQADNLTMDNSPPIVNRRVASLPAPPSRDDFDLPKRRPHALGKSQPVVSQDVLRELAASPSSPSGSPDESLPGKATDEAAVEVKIGELSARIGGCNLAFRAMETALDEKGDWTAAKLEPLLDRLKLLMTRRHDLSLFWNALTESQRSSIDPLASEKSVVSQFAICIDAARQRAEGQDFSGNNEERQAELDRLEKLFRRLTEVN